MQSLINKNIKVRQSTGQSNSMLSTWLEVAVYLYVPICCARHKVAINVVDDYTVDGGVVK